MVDNGNGNMKRNSLVRKVVEEHFKKREQKHETM